MKVTNTEHTAINGNHSKCRMAPFSCALCAFARVLFSEMFIAYCVVYFSPSRKGRKDYLQYQIIRVSSLLYPKWTPYYIVHS